ncbi:Alpha/Beta hydrolase protein [Apiospora arundinis]
MATDRQIDRDQGDKNGTKLQLANDAYTVGWICAISTEYVAARVFLDDEHENPEHIAQHDNNSYTLGRMGKHNVVIAVLPDGEYGTASAASVARDMLHSFPNVRIGLMVGIGGGAPSAKHDIRLGDIVVSAPRDGRGGVFQYDFGKTIQDQTFQNTCFVAQPPTVLRTAISGIKAHYESDGHHIQRAIDTALRTKPRLRKKYHAPDVSTDRLYRTDIIHPVNDANCTISCSADASAIVLRRVRDGDDDNPAVHYGLIASANQLMKDAALRDKLAREKNVLCFEMEAAGLMNHFPCLVIRGICDYADTHKNKEWQGYAATAAAAYAKDILRQIAPNKVEAEERLSEPLLDVTGVISTITEHVKFIKYALGKKEDREILNWLTETNYGNQHSDILDRRQPGTGQWLLNATEYRQWLAKASQTLFCPGMPGAGKTILTSIVIDDLEHRLQDDRKSAVAYIYFNYKQKGDQKIHNLIASLLKQLAQARASLPVAVKQLYDNNFEKGMRPTLEEISRALYAVVSEQSRVFIVVDALDECQMSDDCRAQFLSILFDLQDQSKINLFATSRVIPDINKKFEGIPFLEVRASDLDIRRYLERHIAQLGAVITEKNELKDTVVMKITEAVDGMFLLAQLYLESLQGKDTPRAIREALSGMIPGAQSDTAYSAAYTNAMERIEGQLADWARRAKQVLAWIACAKRQLHKVELQHALAVEHNDLALDQENCSQIEHLVSICAGLVTVDEQSGIIRLVHYTAQEYFESQKARWFPDIELVMTTVCTTYLSFDSFATGHCETDDEFEKRLTEHHLYDYAARNWGLHARAANADDKILPFLLKPAQVDAASQVLLASATKYRGYSQRVLRSTGLHLAAYFGLVWAVYTIGDNHSVDVKDSAGQTSLHLASSEGHQDVATLLIDKGADVKATANNGQTPLHLASSEGHQDVATLLIEKGADVRAAANNGRTSLNWAVRRGHKEVVKLLINKAADVNATANDGWTPLHWALSKGHEEIAKLLIETGADVKAADNGGRTTLHWASLQGYEEVVKLLIEKGVNVKAAANDGRTPLHSASYEGHEKVVQLLLAKSADIKAAENNGRTPLHSASLRDHGKVAKMLIEKGADIQAADNGGGTSLRLASSRGHEELAQLLIEKGADIKAVDNGRGRRCTALYVEAMESKGHEEIAKLLIEKGADVKAADNSGYTALHWASLRGHEEVAKLLIEKGADIKAAANDGRTPLHSASSRGHEEMGKLLIEKGAGVKAADNGGRTPLHCASYEGHEEVAKMLIEKGADIKAAANDGRTPLHSASLRGHGKVANMLIEKDAEWTVVSEN